MHVQGNFLLIYSMFSATKFNTLLLSGWHWLLCCSQTWSKGCFWAFKGLCGFCSRSHLIGLDTDSLTLLVPLVTTFLPLHSFSLSKYFYLWGKPYLFPTLWGMGSREVNYMRSEHVAMQTEGRKSGLVSVRGETFFNVDIRHNQTVLCDFKDQFTYTHQTFKKAYFTNLSKF